jgi:ADP-heptose:LPS heptosyltransferase
MDRKNHGRPVEESFTAQAPIGDLGAILNVNAAKIQQRRYPFLNVNKERKREIMEGGGFLKARHVCGISWASSNKKLGEEKSTRLLDLAPFLSATNYSFVNLQYGDVSQEIENAKAECGIDVHQVDRLDVFHDIDGLLSLIDACDVVLTTCNVTAHLAGALGKQGIVLVPSGKGRIWYWQGDTTSTWYPCLRLVVHENGSDWKSTIKMTVELIEEMFGGKDKSCSRV